jgi:hypothetical protein
VTGSRPVLVVANRHRPHEIAFLLFSLMVGVAFTIGAPPPQSVAAAIPELTRVWASGLLASGIVGLSAVLLPLDVRLSLRLEVGAMLIGAGSLLVTTAAVFSYAGLTRGLFSGGFCAAWMLANLARANQIRRDLRGIE